MLVLDTARFKYPPFWVDIDVLYNSLDSVDEDSGKKRGFILMSKDPDIDLWKNDDDFNTEINPLNKDEFDFMEGMGIDLEKVLPSTTPSVKFISDLTVE